MQSQRAAPPNETATIVPGKPPAPGLDYDAALGGAVTEQGVGFADNLAAALAAFVQSNSSGPKPLPPALIRQRAKAHAEMLELLAELKEKGEMPLYELRADFFCDDVLVNEGRSIRYCEIPNEGMEPKNEAARRVKALFLRWIGGRTPDLADQSYEAYLRRPRLAQVVGEENFVSPLGRPGTLAGAKVEVMEDEEPAAPKVSYGSRPVYGTAPVERPA